ncbi:hypothetical protein PINS_up000313 [Pythium insidiosum]|nr:hypothetical protein PINS_up000313 [Pythium insidiosum]
MHKLQDLSAVRPPEPVVPQDIDNEDVDDNAPLLQADPTDSSSNAAADGWKTPSSSGDSQYDVAVAPPMTDAQARLRRLRGLGYIVIAAANMSAMSACAKHATRFVTSHEAVFWRSLLAFLMNYCLVRYNKVSLTISPSYYTLLAVRCLVGTLSISLQFYAFSKMILTDAVVIVFTSPVVTFLLGALLLREKVERVDFACALVSYIGVIFVARPASLFPNEHNTKRNDTTAVIAALAAAFMQASSYIAMRKLHAINSMAIMHFFLLFGTCFSMLTTVVLHVPLRIPPTPLEAALALVGSACFSTVGLLFLTLGFQLEKAGIASVMRYFDVVFVFLLDITFLGERVNGYSILGGCIILSGAVIIAIRRANERK